MVERRRGRVPDPALDDRLRAALRQLFAERGAELTYDEVAARSGVGRATVFRRYPTKRELIVAAVSQLVLDRIDVPDTGSLVGDLRGLVRRVLATLGEVEEREALRRFHAEANRDEAVAGALRGYLAARVELFRLILDRAVERGDAPAAADPVLLADVVSGMIILRLTANAALPDDQEIGKLVALLINGIGS